MCHVNLFAWPPFTETIYTDEEPDLLDVNATHFPSGEKCGVLSTADVLVNLVVLLFVKLVVQISPPYANATLFPCIVGWRNNRVSCAKTIVEKNNAITIMLLFSSFIFLNF